VAPFTLAEYKDIASRSKQIEAVIQNHLMPPWKADPEYRHYGNENILSDVERQTLLRWISEGAGKSPGNTNSRNKSLEEQFKSVSTPSHDKFLDIYMPAEFVNPGNNDDWVIQIITPANVGNVSLISNIEFLPGNRQMIHHANFKVIRYDKKYDNRIKPVLITYPDIVPGDTRFDEPFDAEDVLFYGGWLPGSSPMIWPEGTGFKVTERLYILFKIHYAPSPVKCKDRSGLRLYYTDIPLKKEIRLMNIGSFGGLAEPLPLLVIPPDTKKQFKVSYKLPVAINMVYIIPHMHLLGENFLAYAVNPAGDTIPLARIKNWDFNWQEFYKFEPAQHLEENTVIEIVGNFDNTNSNPFNHFNPPKWIKQGVSSYDEMLSMVILYYSD
jgi:hypothetical protein